MAYVENNLSRGETVRYRARVHWVVFAPSAGAGAVALSLLLGRSSLSVFFIVLAGVLIGAALIRKETTELALTNKRVIAKMGFLRRSTIEQRLEMVDNIHVEQGILARMFGAGTVSLTGSGASRTPIRGIADPLRFRREVNDAIDDLKSPILPA